jgi:hypothetical protein
LKIYRRAFFQFSTFAALAAIVQAEDKIPTGFKAERYTQLWEHNPFTLVTPRAPEAHPSPFDKLFLTSWLKDDGKFVIFVQNSDTHEVQRITTEPNQDNLRLIEMHLNPNPEFVEAVISGTTQKGVVKFQFASQPSPEHVSSGTAQTGNIVPAPPAVHQTVPHRIYPGVPRVHPEGGPAPAQRGHVSG